jgi:FMN phosphatase YigB (HAD superfamily)
LSAPPAAPRVRAVVFDVGETLIDETTEYGTWADWLGVPRHTFSAMFGAVIARGQDYREVFQHFRPGFNLAEEREKRMAAGLGEFFNARDLYPDVRPCLVHLKAVPVTESAWPVTKRLARVGSSLSSTCQPTSSSPPTTSALRSRMSPSSRS